MRLRERVKELSGTIRELAAASGARDIRLFGSVARGVETAKSDVDFLVALEPGRTLLDLTRLEVALERMLGRRVEIVVETELPDFVLAAIGRDAIRV